MRERGREREEGRKSVNWVENNYSFYPAFFIAPFNCVLCAEWARNSCHIYGNNAMETIYKSKAISSTSIRIRIRIRIRLPFPINCLTFRPVPAELYSNLLSKSQTSLEEFAVSLSRKSNKKNHFSSKEEGVRGGQRPLEWRFAFDFCARLICQTQFSFLFNMQKIRVNLLTF